MRKPKLQKVALFTYCKYHSTEILSPGLLVVYYHGDNYPDYNCALKDYEWAWELHQRGYVIKSRRGFNSYESARKVLLKDLGDMPQNLK